MHYDDGWCGGWWGLPIYLYMDCGRWNKQRWLHVLMRKPFPEAVEEARKHWPTVSQTKVHFCVSIWRFLNIHPLFTRPEGNSEEIQTEFNIIHILLKSIQYVLHICIGKFSLDRLSLPSLPALVGQVCEMSMDMQEDSWMTIDEMKSMTQTCGSWLFAGFPLSSSLLRIDGQCGNYSTFFVFCCHQER